MDALRQRLIASASEMERRRLVALSGLGPAKTVNHRLIHCGRSLDAAGRRFRCNRPLCASCGERKRNARTKTKMLPIVEAAAAGGFSLAHLTIALKPTEDLDAVSAIFQSAKRAIAGCRRRLAARHPVGLSMAGDGTLEIALVPDDQLAHVGARRRETLTELGFPEACHGGPVWCPHLHILLFVPPITSLEEVGEELRRVFRATRQVHMEAVRPGRGFVRSIYRIMRYAMKFEGKTEVEESERRNWTPEEVAMFFDWAERSSRCGMRGLSITFGLDGLPASQDRAAPCGHGEQRQG